MKFLIMGILILLSQNQALAMSESCKSAILKGDHSGFYEGNYDKIHDYAVENHEISLMDIDNPYMDLIMGLNYFRDPYFRECSPSEFESLDLKNCEEFDDYYSCEGILTDEKTVEDFKMNMTVSDGKLLLSVGRQALAYKSFDVANEFHEPSYVKTEKAVEILYKESLKGDTFFKSRLNKFLKNNIEDFDPEDKVDFSEIQVHFKSWISVTTVDAEENHMIHGLVPIYKRNPSYVTWSHTRLIGFIRFYGYFNDRYETQSLNFVAITANPFL